MVRPTRISPNILTEIQLEFLREITESRMLTDMTQEFFNTFLSFHHGYYRLYKDYTPDDFEGFLNNILRSGRYGNRTDKHKLNCIRELYLYSKKNDN
jgi:hypothetical protein